MKFSYLILQYNDSALIIIVSATLPIVNIAYIIIILVCEVVGSVQQKVNFRHDNVIVKLPGPSWVFSNPALLSTLNVNLKLLYV